MAKRSAKKKAIVLASGQQLEVTKEDGKYYYTEQSQFRKAANFYDVIETEPPKREKKSKIAEEGGADNANTSGNQ